MEKLLIIGNGMATAKLLAELLGNAPGRYAITVIGDEPRPCYNRILLSRLLSREIDESELVLHGDSWYQSHHIQLISGIAAERVCTASRTVGLDNGDSVPFDKLVFATGARTRVPALPGIEGDGVLAFRSWSDCEALQLIGQEHRPVVVAGGGLLGIEAACGLAALGSPVTVVHSGAWPLNRQLDEQAGAMLADNLRARGIALVLGARCQRLEHAGHGGLARVILDNGAALATSAAVFATGIIASDELAADAGITCHDGIVTDGLMQTSLPGIYALGECARACGESVGLMEPVNQQAEILARVLADQPTAPWTPSTTPTRLKVTGEEVFSTGELAAEDADAITFCDPVSGSYRKLLVRNNTLVGAVLFGDTTDGNWYHRLVVSSQPLDGLRQRIIYGEQAA